MVWHDTMITPIRINKFSVQSHSTRIPVVFVCGILYGCIVAEPPPYNICYEYCSKSTHIFMCYQMDIGVYEPICVSPSNNNGSIYTVVHLLITFANLSIFMFIYCDCVLWKIETEWFSNCTEHWKSNTQNIYHYNPPPRTIVIIITVLRSFTDFHLHC